MATVVASVFREEAHSGTGSLIDQSLLFHRARELGFNMISIRSLGNSWMD